MDELKRKLQRRKLRRELQWQERARNQALVRLGRQAWEQKVDLASFPALRERLAAMDSRSSELAETSTRLQTEQSEMERRRQDEVAAFDDRRRPIDKKKQQIDSEHRAAGRRLDDESRATKQAEARLATLARQLAALEQKTGSALPAPTAQPSREQLLAEQTTVSARLETAKRALQGNAEEVNRLAGESRTYAEDLAALERQRQAALAPLDAELARVRGQLTTAAQETAGLEREREEQFLHLGLALYEGKTQEPMLGQEVGQIASIDQARDTASASLEASLSLSRALPRGVMLKFGTVLVMASSLALAGGYWLYNSISANRGGDRHGGMTDPTIGESEKDATVKAFIESLRNEALSSEAREKARADAVPILTEDLLTLGSTANPHHFPLLVGTLSSDVPDLRAAAADAIGMIGPTADQTPALATALNDPVPAVRGSALKTLRASTDPYAQELVARARREQGLRYMPESVPGEKELGVPLYPGARFLYFASSFSEGRAAFSTCDEPASVVAFYAGKFHRPGLGLQSAQGPDAGAIPGIGDYSNQQLYGNPMIVVLEEAVPGGAKAPAHFVVVFEDRVFKETGFVLHFIPPPSP